MVQRNTLRDILVHYYHCYHYNYNTFYFPPSKVDADNWFVEPKPVISITAQRNFGERDRTHNKPISI